MRKLIPLKEEARLAIYQPRTSESDGLRRFDIDFPSIAHPTDGAPFTICGEFYSILVFEPTKAGDILLSLVPSAKGKPGAHKMQEIGKQSGISHPKTRIEVRENTGLHITALIDFLEKYILDHLAQPLLFPSTEAVYRRQKKVPFLVKVDPTTKALYLFLPEVIQ